MGFLSFLGLAPDKSALEAQRAPAVMGETFGTNFNGFFGGNFAPSILRNEAMMVPAMARARNLICGVIGTVPLKLYTNKTGTEIENSQPWVDQPDIRQPRSVTIAWTVDSLLFYGNAYWEVKTSYADGRPADFAWVANDRVTAILKNHNTEVDYYLIDGEKRPWSGDGSLVTFQSVAGDGILTTGATIIRAALDVQKAAAIAAQTPMANGYIQNLGADLPEATVTSLLDKWRSKRLANSTAYLTSTLKFENIAFSPAEMMYNEAIQYFATQIARLCNISGYLLDAEVFRSTTYQNVIDERKNFVDFTLRTFISSIEDRLSMDDITPRGQEVRFALDETFLRNDPLIRLQVIAQMMQLGLIDVNQAKKMEELSPGGDDSTLTTDPSAPAANNVIQMPTPTTPAKQIPMNDSGMGNN